MTGRSSRFGEWPVSGIKVPLLGRKPEILVSPRKEIDKEIKKKSAYIN